MSVLTQSIGAKAHFNTDRTSFCLVKYKLWENWFDAEGDLEPVGLVPSDLHHGELIGGLREALAALFQVLSSRNFSPQ